MSFVLIAAMFGAMWYFTIRPQQQRVRAQRALVASLQAGDEVLTAGGLIGRISVVDGDELRLDVGNGLEVRMARSSVQARFGPDPAEAPEEG